MQYNINLVGVCCNGVSFEVYPDMWATMVSVHNHSNRLVINRYHCRPHIWIYLKGNAIATYTYQVNVTLYNNSCQLTHMLKFKLSKKTFYSINYNVFPKPVHTQNMTSPVPLPLFYCTGWRTKTGLPSRRTTWAQVSDSVQEIKQMQTQSTYWLEKVLKMISLYVNALLCTLQHIVIHAMQLSGVNSPN